MKTQIIILLLFLVDVDGFLYDLTYPVNNITLDWGGKQFEINITQEDVKESNSPYYYQVDEISTPTHLGTHLDAPCHFGKGLWCVSDIPPKRLFSRPGYVIDISSKCEKVSEYMLSEDDLKLWLKETGKIEDGAILLVRTGWSRHWPNREEYFGIDSENKMHFPGISPAAANSLLSRKFNIYGIGIEGPSVDPGLSTDFQTHVILARNNIFNLENVGPLIAKLPKSGFLITALPIRIDGSSGSPVRIIAHAKPNFSDSFYLRLIFTFLAVIPTVYYAVLT